MGLGLVQDPSSKTSLPSLDYDVVVVGAGCAGASAAYHAARRGARTLLIDKKKEVGLPLKCAEGTVSNVLKDLNIPLEARWISNICTRMKVTLTPEGSTVEAPLKHFQGIVLDKPAFEKAQVDRAVKAGADLVLQREVVGLDDNGVILDDKTKVKGKVIIGADGIGATLGKWAGIDVSLKPIDIGACAQYTLQGVEGDRNTLEIYLVDFAPKGYAWVFPKGEGIANVGLGICGGQNLSVMKLLERFLKFRVPEAKPLRFTTGAVPLSRPSSVLVRGNVLLTGNAARVVAACSGAGIGNSLLTGKLAGEVAGCYSMGVEFNGRSVESLGLYEEIVKERLFPRLEKAYRMKEKAILRRDGLGKAFGIAKRLVWLHKIAPKTVERYIVKTFLY